MDRITTGETMQDFIKMAAGQLGVSEETSTGATKGVLGMLKSGMDGADFGALSGALPGDIGALLGGGESDAGDAGGLGGMLGGMLGGGGGGGGGGDAEPGGDAGGLGGMLGGMLGGEAGGALAAVMALASSGLGKEQAGQFVQLFLDHIKSEAGGDMLSKVLSAVPQLKALAGMVT